MLKVESIIPRLTGLPHNEGKIQSFFSLLHAEANSKLTWKGRWRLVGPTLEARQTSAFSIPENYLDQKIQSQSWKWFFSLQLLSFYRANDFYMIRFIIFWYLHRAAKQQFAIMVEFHRKKKGEWCSTLLTLSIRRERKMCISQAKLKELKEAHKVVYHKISRITLPHLKSSILAISSIEKFTNRIQSRSKKILINIYWAGNHAFWLFCRS